MSLPFTVSVSAADTSHIKYEYIGTERDSVPFTLCDSLTNFKVRTGDALTIDRQNMVGGIACVDYKISANEENLISVEYITERPVDGSGYTFVEMDIYLDSIDFVSDLEYANLEFSSEGKSDVAEISFDFFSGLTTGWNYIKFALDDAVYTSTNNKQFDISHVNYLRIQGVTKNALNTTLNIKLDDVYFTKGNGGSVANVPVTMGESIVGFSMGANGYNDLDKTIKVAGNASVKCVVRENSQRILACQYNPADPIDASGLTHLELDLYVKNATFLSYITSSQFEISSAGGGDKEEVSFNIAPQLKAGWNHLVLPLKEGTFYSSNGKDFDITRVNYFRFYANLATGVSMSIQLNIDNMSFTDGNGVTVYQPKGGNYKNEYVSDSIPNFGDLNDDKDITVIDALTALQGNVNAINLTNVQLIKADVNNDGKFGASDALYILQYTVGSRTTFAAKEALSDYSKAPELGFTTPTLVKTKFYTDHAVVAEVDVTGFGAYGDGRHDDYLAFQSALDYVEIRGGGTVFAPVGTYKISRALYIPEGVTLMGDNPIIDENGSGRAEGTVLYAYSGRNKQDGENFIQLDLGAGVHNLSIYYPEQDPNNIVPYSYTIKQMGHYGRSVNNVNFINSYNGIKMGPDINALQNIVNISGTILNNGIFLDQNIDICRMEGIYFSPKYWLNGGLETFDATSEQNVRTHLKTKSTGLTLQHIDWVYMSDLYVDGYYTAAKLCQTDRLDASGQKQTWGLNGQFYNFNATNCYIGINCDYLNSIGMIFTKGNVSADYPFICGTDCKNSLSLNSVNLNTSGDYGFKSEGTSDVTFENCTITNTENTTTGVAISLSGGSVAATNCTIENFVTDVQLTDNAKASMAINVNTESTLKVDDVGELLTKTWDDEYKNPVYTEKDYKQQLITRPSADNFIDFTKYEYSGDTSKGIAGKLQAAIDELHAQGGGMIYFPAGRYNLETNIVVKSGVEIRGSATNPHHNQVNSTVFYSEYGRYNVGNDSKAAAADALFTLESKAGLSGFKVARENQFSHQVFVPYAYTIRGNGFGVYVNNVSDLNPYFGIDFDTNKCDAHVVNGYDGAPLEIGVVVGGGSANGVVKNCQLICHFYYDGPYVGYQDSKLTNDLVTYQKANLDCFTIKNTVDQIFFNNFGFGTLNGIIFDEGADVFVLTQGIDSTNYPIRVKGPSNGGKIEMVNTQLAVLGTLSDHHYVDVEASFDGDLNCVQTNMWGNPINGMDIKGGKVSFTGVTVLASGNFGARIYGNTVFRMSGMHNRHSTGVLFDIFSNNNTASIIYFANRYSTGKAKHRVNAKYVKTTEF